MTPLAKQIQALVESQRATPHLTAREAGQQLHDLLNNSPQEFMTVWLVGTSDCEGTRLERACADKAAALARCEEIRNQLVLEAKARRAMSGLDSLYDPMIEKLSAPDIEKLDCYPHDTPFIKEMVVE